MQHPYSSNIILHKSTHYHPSIHVYAYVLLSGRHQRHCYISHPTTSQHFAIYLSTDTKSNLATSIRLVANNTCNIYTTQLTPRALPDVAKTTETTANISDSGASSSCIAPCSSSLPSYTIQLQHGTCWIQSVYNMYTLQQ